ncbi:NAD-dependent epimerase/dehydratase family protein [Haladaptatus pallidirubidus]|uniref:NAD-dependent 4,6-dehydratase LegB n=1 Tax=Haladaptatus pallidirubidus TaxID=1008152 RepID=A0AAV3UPL3_9EURY|nr:NAD(P)-dependent oxidoreductase [Haladaptatus pallidirubidus]
MSDSVLVTGGSGFIGRHVLKELESAGYSITALTHSSSLPDYPEITTAETVSGDITRLETLPAFDSYDIVVHLAGIVSVDESLRNPKQTYDVNTTGTVNIFERSREGNVDVVVYISSAAVYGIPEQLPISETHPVDALHPYAASKLMGEQIAKATSNAYELDISVIRPFTTYGAGQQSDNLIPEVISQLQEGVSVLELGNLSPTRDFVHVRDVASAIRTIIDSNQATMDVYNVGSEQEVTVRKVVEYIQELMDSDAEVKSSDKRDKKVEIPRMVSDCSRLKNLGWQPTVNLESGLKQTIKQVHYE